MVDRITRIGNSQLLAARAERMLSSSGFRGAPRWCRLLRCRSIGASGPRKRAPQWLQRQKLPFSGPDAFTVVRVGALRRTDEPSDTRDTPASRALPPLRPGREDQTSCPPESGRRRQPLRDAMLRGERNGREDGGRAKPDHTPRQGGASKGPRQLLRSPGRGDRARVRVKARPTALGALRLRGAGPRPGPRRGSNDGRRGALHRASLEVSSPLRSKDRLAPSRSRGRSSDRLGRTVWMVTDRNRRPVSGSCHSRSPVVF